MRLPLVSPNSLTPEQRALYDRNKIQIAKGLQMNRLLNRLFRYGQTAAMGRERSKRLCPQLFMSHRAFVFSSTINLPSKGDP